MFTDANWFAIVGAAVSTFVLGFFWYNPKTFGTAWMNSIGMTEEKIQEGNMPLIFGLSFVFALLAAAFLRMFVVHDEGFGHGAFHGMMMSVVFVMPALATNALYEQRNIKYILINVGYWVASFSLMGGILGQFQ